MQKKDNLNLTMTLEMNRINQIHVDKMYAYLDTLVTHAVSPLLLLPLALRGILENIKRGIEKGLNWLCQNDPNQDIWSYCELLHINPIVFDDHLVITLQVLLVDKFLIMNVYKIYNLLILHPVLQKTF